jgi:hypothetical protein
MNGYGGFVISMITEYSFIDSSYAQILIRYGWMTYIVANILWVYTTDKAIRINNRRLAFAMTLIAADFFMEHHWFELCYDVFLVVPFAEFGIRGAGEGKLVSVIRQKFEDKKYRIPFFASSFACLVILFFMLPLLFSYLRTIFNGYGYAGGGERAKTVFAAITAAVVLLLIIILSICNGVATYLAESKIAKHNLAVLGTAIAIAAALILRANYMIDDLTVAMTDRIEQEKDIINIITENAEGKVYVDELPEAYIRSGLNIDRAYYSGEDLARSSCVTVVINEPSNYGCFLARGFLYLPLSLQDAIYTNDDGVIKALKNNGYILKGYNSYVHMVDLEYTAEISGAELSEDGGILLGDRLHSFSSLPKVGLTGGTYTAKYKLRIENEPYTDDYKLGNILITAYDGEIELVRVDIMRSDFDENGELEYEIPFGGYGRNCEFHVSVEGDNKLEIESIKYACTPGYDVHIKVDSRGRVIRSEYYDLDGNPKEMPEGYYGFENGYNKQDLIIYTRYLGSDYEPLTLASGYCIIRKEYDSNKQAVKEAYYDVNDNPTLNVAGYHYYTMDYDFHGNVICEEYYGLSGEPVLVYDLYQKVIIDYDESGEVAGRTYYDLDGNVVKEE